MKKTLLFVGLLALQHLAFAACSVSPHEAYTWKMNIKNDTPDDLQITDCYPTPSTPQSVAKHSDFTEISWKICTASSYSPSTTGSSCKLTDPVNGASTTLVITFVSACNDVHTSEKDTVSPLLPFYCGTAYHTAENEVNGSLSGCSSSQWTINNTAYFDVAYIYPQYSVTWNNVVMSLVKGQTMATNLGLNLLKAIAYDKATSSYNTELKQVSITLSKNTATNPYTNGIDGPSCKSSQEANA